MGIMSQLRDEAGGDVDMSTLAQLLTGLSQGRWTDQTPFGMWGVRNMDPGKLGTLMDTASEINQRRMGAQEAADASRRGSMNSLEGTLDRNDVEYDRGMMDLQGKLAGNESRWAGENLRSKTELQKEGLRGASAERAAGIMANPKSMMKIPDQTWMMIFQTLQNKKATPEQLQAIRELIELARSTDAPAAAQKMLDQRQAGTTKRANTSKATSSWDEEAEQPLFRPGSFLDQFKRPSMGSRFAADEMLP